MKSNELEQVKNRMQEVGLPIEQITKECSFALQSINKSKMLAKTSIESRQAAILNIAQIGLTLNPALKLAYLVPRYDSVTRSTICCLEPSYQGLVKLLTDTGSVVTITTQLVYENDFFESNLADFQNPITHKPKSFGDRGAVVGVYSLAELPNGSKQSEIMSIEQLHEIREYSESYKAYKAGKLKSCVWTTHEGEMMRKTVLRRFVKYLPKSEQYDKVAEAIVLDESDYKPSENKIYYAKQLLESSTMSDRMEIGVWELRIDEANSDELTEVIEELKERQYDNGRYSMTEVGKQLDEVIKHDNK